MGIPRALAQMLLRIDRVLAAYVRARPRDRIVASAIGGTELERDVDQLVREHEGAAMGSTSDDDGVALADIARRFELDPFEREVLLFAIAPELDGRYGRIYADLGDNPVATRLTVGLGIQLLGGGDLSLAPRLAPHGRLRQWGLCEAIGHGTLAETQLAVPADVWIRCLGADPPARFVDRPALPLDSLLLDESTSLGITRMRTWIGAQRGAAALAVIRGRRGSGRTAVAQAAAGRVLAAAGSELGEPDAVRRFVRDARFADATALVTLAGAGASPGIASLEAIASTLARPIVAIVDEEPLTSFADSTLPLCELEVAPLDPARRAAIWSRALGEQAMAVDTVRLGATMRVGPGRIQRAVELARHRTPGAALDADQLRGACRTLGEAELAGVARRLPCDVTWDDLVITDAARKELELIATWARLAGTRSERRQIGAGFAALFHGPSGTGKTLAAQVIAAAVGLDLYRVDLSQVVDKYIGETEKNLARVFGEAERTNVILFFDEADALFGKRTEVKDAHDRWANIETGFLLQRIEEHPGLSILATNLLRNLDEAHMRRLHVKAEFPRPDVAPRQAIWARHLQGREVEGLDIAYLARQFELAGGDIRNAAMIAELLAAGEHAPLAMRHLVIAAFRELRKAGRLVSPEDLGPWHEVLSRYAGVATSRSRSNGSSRST